MSNSCSAFATKPEVKKVETEVNDLRSELNQLVSELDGKIDREEKPEIVKAGGALGLGLATAALSPEVRAVAAKLGALAGKLANLATKIVGILNLIATLATIAYVTYLEYRLGKAEAQIRTLETLVANQRLRKSER